MDIHKQIRRSLSEWLEQSGHSPSFTLEPLAGGDINDTSLLRDARGNRFCLKTNAQAPENFFSAEAVGLRALAAGSQLRVPEVLLTGESFILMEYIAPAERHPDYWQRLGEGLARMHATRVQCFGFEVDNYCGLTPQPNPRYDNGHDFFREQRLLYQARLAFDRGLLNRAELSLIEAVANKLSELAPEQGPALIHGDLWAGNIHVDEAGQPVLIDPAAWWGWPEAELAMTQLFGGFSEDFYSTYLSVHPLEPGWRERMPLYNLYHLLNHLNLFGRSWHAQLFRVARRFA